MIFKYDGEWFGNCISQFSQHSGMHVIRSHRLMHVQVPQMAMNLIFSILWTPIFYFFLAEYLVPFKETSYLDRPVSVVPGSGASVGMWMNVRALVKISLVLPSSRSWIWSSLTVGETLLLQSQSCDPSTRGIWKERLPVKLRQKLLSIPAFSSLAVMFASCFHQGVCFHLPSFSGWHTHRSHSSYSLE